MNTFVTLSESDIRLTVSKSAEKALAALSSPLYAEMELYFSCMIKKVVSFHRNPPKNREFTHVGENLAICFRSVATASCGVLL